MNSVLNVRKAAGSAALVFPQSQIEVFQVALGTGVRAFLLEGEPGTGKTALGRALGAQAVNQGGHFVFAQANAWASDEFLIRGIDLAGFVENDPDRVYAPGLLMTAARLSVETPRALVFVLLDEWDKTRPVADGLMLAALEERVVVDAAGRQLGAIGDNVIFWITSNASRELHPALRRRVLRQRLNPLDKQTLVALLRQAGVGQHAATYLAALRDQVHDRTMLTLPDLLRAGGIVGGLSSVDACRFLLAGFGLTGGEGADLWAAVCRDRKAAA